MKYIKIYQVEFLQYTNCFKDTVSDGDDSVFTSKSPRKYLDVGHEHFLIAEDDLSYFKQFGGGFRSVEFVGRLAVREKPDELEDLKTGNTNPAIIYERITPSVAPSANPMFTEQVEITCNTNQKENI